MHSAFLDRVYLAVRWLGVLVREARRPRARAAPGVRVFYGHDELPGRGEIAGGGIIKCQDLQVSYPNSPADATILYLVNSALPLHAPLIARFALRRGMRLVLNQNGVAYPAWYGRGWEAANRPNRYLMARADHVFYQSEFSRVSAGRFVGQPAGSWEILHNPVDTAVFSPAARPVVADALTLLLAGSHYQRYRAQAAVDCLAELVKRGRNVRLVIAGRCSWHRTPGKSESELRDYIRAKGVERQVRLAGPYTQHGAPDLFRSAHILLHTKYNDPCPRLVVEALACGLPVAYSATGGTPELVGDEAGVGVPAPLDWERIQVPDAAALADAVQTIAASLDSFSRNARARAVARFGLPAWLERHRAVFERVAAGAAGRQPS